MIGSATVGENTVLLASALQLRVIDQLQAAYPMLARIQLGFSMPLHESSTSCEELAKIAASMFGHLRLFSFVYLLSLESELFQLLIG